MRVAVIMAGGAGERFWPLSRKNRPKQFLALTGAKPMLAETVDRVLGVPGVRDVYIVAGPHLKKGILEILPSLPEENVLVEPTGKNTAPCLAFAAAVIANKHGPDAVMGVMTADSLIGEPDVFCRNADLAFHYAERNDVLMTLGVPPTHPNTGFGYLELGAVLESDSRGAVRRIASFREKPDPETARRYVEAGNFLWNSGMFFWKCATLLRALEEFMPELADGARRIGEAVGSSAYERVLAEVFAGWPSISIDYAVMEKARNVCAVAGEFAWDDVGTWNALARTHALDENGNLRVGRTLVIDTRNCILHNLPDAPSASAGDKAKGTGKQPRVVAAGDKAKVTETPPETSPGRIVAPGDKAKATETPPGRIVAAGDKAKATETPPETPPGRIVATLGVENLVVVVSNSAVLICRRDRAQDIKQVIQALRDEEHEEFL